MDKVQRRALNGSERDARSSQNKTGDPNGTDAPGSPKRTWTEKQGAALRLLS